MGIVVEDVSLLSSDIKYVKDEVFGFIGINFIGDIKKCILKLEDSWKSKAGCIYINSLIESHNSLIESLKSLSICINKIGNILNVVSNISNDDSSRLTGSFFVDFKFKKMDRVEYQEKGINMELSTLNSCLDTLNSLKGTLLNFENKLDVSKRKLFDNWTDGLNIDVLIKEYNLSIENAGVSLKMLNSTIDNISEEIKKISMVGFKE